MEKRITFRGGNLNYRITGQGSGIVFLHGFLEDHTIWNDFADRLSDRFTVIQIDLPGFGKSSVVDDVHSMSLMAGAVEKVLDEENIGQCIMIGHSMGGYVTLAFAKLFPEKLKGIVLFHSQAAADDEEGKNNRNRTIEIVKKNHKDFITSFIPLLFAEENVSRFSKEIRQLQKSAVKTSAEGVVAALAGMRDREDNRELLASIDIPVLIIIGKQDSRIAMETIMPQLSLPKNCEAIILDNVGHLGFLEAEGLTYASLEHFIERNLDY
ncbi:MAG TPA: alpha/beta hydrolase [Bacteroidetes bacterium]|nr:alpha/beta hydrolase [Bacteroidota bacterium]